MATFQEQGAASSAHPLTNARVTDASGMQARIASFEYQDADTMLWIQPEHGAQIRVPQSMLIAQPDGSYSLPFTFDASESVRIPVIEEELHVSTRKIDTGRGVRIHKSVSEHLQTVDEPLEQDELLVQTVPMDTLLEGDAIPQARQEGDTYIVPVLEEVLVVEKRIRLKEEVRITRTRKTVHAPQTVTVRSEQVDVERFDEGRGDRA